MAERRLQGLTRAWQAARVCVASAGARLGRAALLAGLAAAAGVPAAAQGPQAQGPQAQATAPSAAAPGGPVVVTPGWVASAPARTPPVAAQIQVPRIGGRLTVDDLGLVINTSDPYSVAVGEHYIRRRGLRPEQVLRVQLPVVPMITPEQFDALRKQIDARFGRNIQALALAWVGPYAVHCNSITGALAIGYDPGLCERSCAPTKPSRYFNAPVLRPYADLGIRLSMLLAAPSIEQAKALIDRGVAADFSLSRRGRPPVTAMFVQTTDAARAVRQVLYPPAGPITLPLPQAAGVTVRVEPASRMNAGQRVFALLTGAANLDLSQGIDWAPGALADHLTSFGGDLLGGTGQSNAMEWIASGATASHGTVTEPCNHLQKFPHPQVLLLNYLQGATALEAYWRSVAWPQQALFVGEPLAAPFSPQISRSVMGLPAPAEMGAAAAPAPAPAPPAPSPPSGSEPRP